MYFFKFFFIYLYILLYTFLSLYIINIFFIHILYMYIYFLHYRPTKERSTMADKRCQFCTLTMFAKLFTT